MDSDAGPAAASRLFTLVIEPDDFDVDFTHFRGVRDNVQLLHRCPDPVKRMIDPVIEKLLHLRISHFKMDALRDGKFWVRFQPDKPPVPSPITGKMPKLPDPLLLEIPFPERKKALEALRITAWWVEYDYRRLIANLRGEDLENALQTFWICPDCNERVPRNREHCSDPDCPSWDTIFLATAEPTLHLVRAAGGNSA